MQTNLAWQCSMAFKGALQIYFKLLSAVLLAATEDSLYKGKGRLFESSHRDLLIKYLFDGGYLPGKFVSVRGIGISWKIVCVRGLDRASWKMNIMFDEKIEAPEKFVCVRGLNKGFWEN